PIRAVAPARRPPAAAGHAGREEAAGPAGGRARAGLGAGRPAAGLRRTRHRLGRRRTDRPAGGYRPTDTTCRAPAGKSRRLHQGAGLTCFIIRLSDRANSSIQLLPFVEDLLEWMQPGSPTPRRTDSATTP